MGGSGSASGHPERPRIFDYPDYRAYLSAYFAHRKAVEPGFSIRIFSRHPELRLSSSSFLSAVLKARKNLSQPLRLRMGRALGLGPAEQDYFEALIQADQSRTTEERAHFRARLARLGGAGAMPVAEAGTRFHSRWWYPVVWHWIALHPGQSNPARIAKAIRPPLEPAQAEEAIRALTELKLIKRLANGYAVTERHVAGGPGMAGEPSRAYARDFLALAAGALEANGAGAGTPDPAGPGGFQVLTMALGARAAERLRAKLAALAAEVRDLVEQEGAAGPEARVFALALQMFPCSEEGDPAEGPPARGLAAPGTTAELAIPPG